MDSEQDTAVEQASRGGGQDVVLKRAQWKLTDPEDGGVIIADVTLIRRTPRGGDPATHGYKVLDVRLVKDGDSAYKADFFLDPGCHTTDIQQRTPESTIDLEELEAADRAERLRLATEEGESQH